MSPERWQEVKAGVAAALDCAPGERAACLDRLCGADAALRREIESLLAASDRAGAAFLARPAAEEAGSVAPPEADGSSALAARIDDALGDRFDILRELGGGGMSRVFLATERALERRVVIKLLRLEPARGLSITRFQREIALAARLQHANVVPLLSAGEVDGLPYYTMPYVDGESLRARLAHGPLPVREVVVVLRDVARALAYAHAHGVVHRDIKPDNVLVSGGAALVTDFGIAKALGAARPVGDSGQVSGTLTRLSSAIGTPAYMAPEQAAADPGADHRLDIYAFGCLAYELLAGVPPFHGRTPRQLLVAHMTERPPLLEALRPDVPEALARLVAECLEKDRDARPASAEALLHMLDGVGTGDVATVPAMLLAGRAMFRRALTLYAVAFLGVAALAKALVALTGVPDWVLPGALIVMALGLPYVLVTGYAHHVARRAAAKSTHTPNGSPAASHGTVAQLALRVSPHLSWQGAGRWVGVGLGGFAALVAGFMILRASGLGPFGALLASGQVGSEPLLVADFSTVQTDSTLGPVIGQAVHANLEQSSAVRVLSRSALAAALRRMRRSPGARVDVAVAREVAEREGLRAIVDGEIAGIGSGFLVTVRVVSADSGRVLASFHEAAGDVKELIAVVDRLSRKLRGRIGESLRDVRASPPLAQVTTASLDALRQFTAASRAVGAGENARAIALARDAVAIDTGFALAWRVLAGAMQNAGYPPAAVDAAIARAYAARDRGSGRERLEVTAEYFAPGPGRDRARAIAAYEALFAMGDRANTNSLGLLLTSRREFARAESLARVRIRVDPDFALTYRNLASWQLRQGRLAQAESTIAVATRRFPTWAQSDAWTQALLQYGRGRLDSAVTVLEAARRDGAARPSRTNLALLADLALLRGQLSREAQFRAEAAAITAGAPAGANADTAWAVLRDGWLFGPSARLAARVASAVAHPEFVAAAPSYRPYFPIARAFARAGRPDRARAILARYQAEVTDTAVRRAAGPALHDVLGEILLAERRPLEAAAEFRRGDVAPDGPASNCMVCLAAALARAYDAAGDADSTIAAIERYLSVSPSARLTSDSPYAEPFSTALSEVSGTRGDAIYLAPLSKRLGELYEAGGDVARAAQHYQTFLALWGDADPALQPAVTHVRRRLASLPARAPASRELSHDVVAARPGSPR